jgi:hypothetical protein
MRIDRLAPGSIRSTIGKGSALGRVEGGSRA